MNVSLAESGALSLLGMTIVFAMLISIMVVILIVTRAVRGKDTGKIKDKGRPEPVPAAAPVISAQAQAAAPRHEAPGSAGEIKLYDVPEKQAAMIMAIVADHLNTPLNQLRFKSIKRID